MTTTRTTCLTTMTLLACVLQALSSDAAAGPPAWKTLYTSPTPFDVAGMVASPTGPVLYIGDAGGGALMLVRAPDWRAVTFARDLLTSYGHIAANGDRLVVTAKRLGLKFTLELLQMDLATGEATTLVTGCGLLANAHVAMSPTRSVIVAQCNEVLHVFESKDGKWQELTTVPEPRLVDAIALDAHDHLHYVRRLHHGEVDAVVAIEPTRAPLSAPKDVTFGALARCGNDLYASYQRGAYDAPEVGVARWTGSAWQYDTIAAMSGTLVIGFDERCAPFAAFGDQVWRKSAGTWTDVSLGRPAAWVDALLAYKGTLYVALHEVRDGVSSSVVTLPLAP